MQRGADAVDHVFGGRKHDIDVLSLDVFDSLVVRKCGRPEDLFLLLGRRLTKQGVIGATPEVFARARGRAEQTVWQREGGLDSHATLDMIYEEVCRRLGLPFEQGRELASREFELELELLRPTPLAERVAHYRASADIVFTTDTYFTASQVATILDRFSLRHPGDVTLVSSELGASKATGTLFMLLLDRLGVPPESVLHVGDNPHSDVDVPRSLGVRAIWLPETRKTRYEARLCDGTFETSGLASVLAGASRAARLTVAARNNREESIRDVAAGVAGPALIAFVLWILHQAHADGRKRLYFLARDGRVLLPLAERLAPALGMDIDLRYLAVSRQSTNLAATFDLVPEETGWVFRDATELSIREMCSRFDVSWNEVAPLLDCNSSPDDPASRIVPALQCQMLGDGSPLREMLLDRASRRRASVLKFLEQEGFFEDVPFGLVDFGGVGSQIRALWKLSEVNRPLDPPTAYLVGVDDPRDAGLDEPGGPPDWLEYTSTWLYDHRRRRGWRRQRGFGTLFQVFCASDHGTVLGYREQHGEMVPVLESEVDDTLVEWGLPVLWSTVDRVASELVLGSDLVDPDADLRDIVVSLIDELWTSPSLAEAQAWGDFPLEGASATDLGREPLAREYSLDEVVSGVARGTFPNLGWRHWFEASLVRSPSHIEVPLRWALSAYEGSQASRWTTLRSGANALTRRRDRHR